METCAAEPAPVDPRSEIAVARYNQVLTNGYQMKTTELHFQRSMLYDSVGLSGLAQFDYTQAINLKPDLAEAYNSMGIIYSAKRLYSGLRRFRLYAGNQPRV